MTKPVSEDIGKWEATEMAAWRSIFEVAPPAVVEELQLSKAEHASLTVFRTLKIPSWFFNRILVRVEEPVSRELLDAELERFASSGTPHGVCVPPGATPAELPTWLAERRLQRTTTLARMIRTTEGLPSAGVDADIRQVGREDAAAFGGAVVRGFGLPPLCAAWIGTLASMEGWRSYLAYVDGSPVATGSLFIHGQVGWLGNGTTLPAYRNRGIHRAVLVRRMKDAASLGCRWLQTETNLPAGDEPTPSLNNMKRLGFEMAYARPNYVFTPPAT